MARSLLFYDGVVSRCVYVYDVYTTCSLSIDGILGCFHILAILSNALVNVEVYVSFQVGVFIFLG